MELPADLNGCSAAIPAALEEMMTSHNNIGQISQYCKSAYQQNGDVTPELFAQTKQYTNDALLNVAYHVHQVSLQLTNYLQVQSLELEKVDLQIRTITDRLKAIHDQAGSLSLRTMEAVRGYQPVPEKIKKLPDGELPENARPQPKFGRLNLNLNALDSVGHMS